MRKTMLIKILCSSLASLILTACSEDNPLNEKPVADAANLLTMASEKASVSIGLKPARAGDNYRLCMQKKLDQALCNHLIRSMKKELSKEHVIVTEAQITDKILYKNIAAQLDHSSWLME